jgi:hypothetical protein
VEEKTMLALHEKYIVNDKGKKTATILPFSEWKKILMILEEYEDIQAYDKAKTRPSHPASFKNVVKKLKLLLTQRNAR